MATAFIKHPDCSLHDMGAGHPESPDRLAAIEDHLISTGLMEHLVCTVAPEVTREQLLRVHDQNYVESIEAVAPQKGFVHLDPDTAMNPYSLSAAKYAAGAVVKATDMVISGEVENGFCNVRPPGHHACRRKAMGFCLFNNIAVGVAHAIAVHGLDRVAIVDFDVHHGNGTEDIFVGDQRVIMVSTFQHPFYPYSGAEGRSKQMVNIPLAAYSGSAQFRGAVEREWIPALHDFAPQMIFVSAGFDAHRDDDMASLALSESDYAWVTRQIVDVAQRYADRRIVSTLEGGYNLEALARSVAAHVRGLCEI
ncbi:MAG TPA: histone deacetylase family protein [Burkholderiales bacterium]|nr:histone deacetylase family protein [Burkholderiales bacterium]